MSDSSPNTEIRQLRAENAALQRELEAAGRPAAIEPSRENARLRILLADVHTALLAAGWRDDELLARVKEEVK